MQLAAQQKLHKLDNETVHWIIFAPAYRNRWNDDINITPSESNEYGFGGKDRYTKEWKVHRADTWLHQHRKEIAEKVKEKRGPGGKPAISYLDRISQICRQHRIIFKPIDRPGDFWSYLSGLQNGSISRVWYCGHASTSGLFLDLDHDLPATDCIAVSSNRVTTDDIRNNSASLKPKIFSDTDKVSEFYGCNTASFAHVWNQEFEVATAGANNKITFQAIYSGDQTKSVLERLRTQPTNSGSPDWRSFTKP
jgi:hypothetical protein